MPRIICFVFYSVFKFNTWSVILFFSGHWLDGSIQRGSPHKSMFILNGRICNQCNICIRDKLNIVVVDELTDMQKKHFRKLNIPAMKEQCSAQNLPELYKRLCKMLAILSNVPCAEEFGQVYRFFRKCILFLQNAHSDNIILDYE